MILTILGIPISRGLWQLWFSNINYNGFLIAPFLTAFVVMTRRDELATSSIHPFLPAIYTSSLTLLLLLIATWEHQIRTAAIVWIASLGWLVRGCLGKQVERLLRGPLVLMCLMIPPSDGLLRSIIQILRYVMVWCVDGCYSTLSNPFEYLGHEGPCLHFSNNLIVTVGEDCSGARSMMGLAMIATFYGVFHRLRPDKAGLLMAMGIFAAIALNFVRIAAAIELQRHGYGKYAEGAWHGWAGVIGFTVGLCAISAGAKILSAHSKRVPADAHE